VARSRNNDKVDNRPAQLLELVSIESFLQGKNEQNHAERKQAKRVELMVLEQHIIQEGR